MCERSRRPPSAVARSGWSGAWAAQAPPPTGGVPFGEAAFWKGASISFWVVLPVGLGLALRNLRLGRGDRAGAWRVALIVSAAFGLSWLLSTRLTAQPFGQMLRLATEAGYALFSGGAMPTLDLGRWYGTPAVVYLLVVAALTLYGFRVSLGRRPAFSASFFGD